MGFLRGPLLVVIPGRRVAIRLAAASVAAGLFLGLAAWWLRPQPAAAPFAETVPGRVVAIDPGHGGPDPGAIGVTGVREKDITLAIARELQQLLHRSAVYTVMTRTGDHDLIQGERVSHRQREDLRRRAALANEAGVDVFVSLHANSFPSPVWSGAQTFYRDGDEESRRLAVAIQTALVQQLGPNRRTARPADLAILRAVEAPAALVEVGFLSNPQEEQLLKDPAYQRRLAAAIAHGIFVFLSGQAAPAAATAFEPAGDGPRAYPLQGP